MHPLEHLTVHQLREAELVSWAEQVRRARDRQAAQPPAEQPPATHRSRAPRPAWLRRLLRARPATRRPA